MRMRNNDTGQQEQVLLDIPTACAVYSIGRNRMLEEAAAAGARVRLGKRLRISKKIMDEFYESQAY